MPKFTEYLHVERLEKDAVQGILNGECYLFPKMDGTNASLWLDEEGNLCSGSRTRQLVVDNDNAGFYSLSHDAENKEFRRIYRFLQANPNLIIYGEWMGATKFVGSIKYYNEEAKGKFFIFDVYDTETETFYSYGAYTKALLDYGLEDYIIPCLEVIHNPSVEELVEVAENHRYMLNHNDRCGEGIVIKNYDFRNRWGAYAVAKLVLDEFKQNKSKSRKKIDITAGEIEKAIIDYYITDSELSKSKSKVCVLNDAEEFDVKSGKMIGMFLNMIFNDLLDECSNWVKRFKNPTINFKMLKDITYIKGREYLGL